MAFQYAGRYIEALLKNSSGTAKLLSGIPVIIRETDGTTLATVYEGRSKTATAANPVITSADGNVDAWLDPGNYLGYPVIAGVEQAAFPIRVEIDPEEADAPAAADVTFAPAGGLAATDVQAALVELDTEKATAAGLAAHEADATDAHDASAVSFTPAGAVASTDVQAAIVEVASDAAAALAGHDADTTNVHGIADTAALALASSVTAEAAARAAADALLIPLTEKGAASGVATLGADGKLPSAQLPDLAISAFLGTTASEAAMLALDGQRGDWTVRTDSDPDTTWMLTADDPTLLANWRQLSVVTDAVASVNGRTGAVVGLAEAADLTAEAAARATADALLVPKSVWDANSLVIADADNTPIALTVAASQVVGRKAAGGIVAMTTAELRAILATVDDTAPAQRITGINGLSPRSLAGRKTTAGAPTTGTWAVDDEVIDSAGVLWRCTVAGTPGTWVQVTTAGTSATVEPVIGWVATTVADEAVVSDSKVFLGTLDGIAYARGTAATTTLYRSTDDLATWTTIRDFGGSAIVGIYDTFDGEVIVADGTTIFKSSGWEANPLTATWSSVASTSNDDGGFARANFIPSVIDTYGQYVILGEYVVPRNNSRRVRLSTDHGLTFSTVMDLNADYVGQEANTHIHGVAIDGFKSGTPRLWMTHGDGPRAVRYSDNLGVDWTTLPDGGGVTPSAHNFMTVTATEYGMVLTTDSNAPDGVYRILRTADPTHQVLELIEGIPYTNSAGTLLGFGIRPWRDPETGWVYVTFSTTTPAASGSADLPGFLFVSDGLVASTVWTSVETAPSATGGIYPDGVGVTASGLTVVAYKDESAVQRRATLSVKRGNRFRSGADPLGGVAIGRGSVVRGYRASAGYDAVAIGTVARTVDSTAGNYRAVAVGADATAATDGVAIGKSAGSPLYNYCTHVGGSSVPSAVEGTAVGYNTKTGLQSVAVGRDASADVNQAVAIGKGASVTQASGVAIGIGATASGSGGAVAIGNVTAAGAASVVIGGWQSSAAGSNGVAIGAKAVASAQYAIALGTDATASHIGSVVLGRSSGAAVATTATNQLALGKRHVEITDFGGDPSAPAATQARWYVKDNGSGKLQLCVRFPTGAVQVVATEP